MSQKIMTEESFTLGPDADLTEDAPTVQTAIRAAFDAAIELGGHEQKLRSITVEMDDELSGWVGAISRPGRVILETELA